jgi:hypothetical protein
MGGREKTGVPSPDPGEFGVFVEMPYRIGQGAGYGAAGDEFGLRRRLGIAKTVKIPAEKLTISPGRGNPLEYLRQIGAYRRFSAVTAEGIYPDFHLNSISRLSMKNNQKNDRKRKKPVKNLPRPIVTQSIA